MHEPIVSVDSSQVLDGKLDELKAAINDLVAFVESNEQRPIAYNIYLNAPGTLMTVVQIHPDSASMEFHMKIAAPAFSKFIDLIKLSTLDVYGTPSDGLLALLRQKVALLGKATVAVHERHAGFMRLGAKLQR